MKFSLPLFAILFGFTSVVVHAASYRSLPAGEKLGLVMDQVRSSAYAPGQLPTKGLTAGQASHLICQRFLSQAFIGDIANPTDNSDILPASRNGVKVVHRYGSVASVLFRVTNLNHPFTGMFRYDSVGLVRLAPALHSESKLIPALALKLFSDAHDSVNFHALYSLEGQPGDNNYFSNPLKTRLGAPGGLPEKILNYFFQASLKRVPNAPHSSLALPLDEAALRNQDGTLPLQPSIPASVEFRPTADAQKLYAGALATPPKPNEYRERFEALPSGLVLYKVFATAADGAVYEIGEIEMTSQLVASLYGDSVLFFKHQVRAAAK